MQSFYGQDQRAVKRVTRPMLNFKSFPSAKCALAGIELRHMIRKGQFMMQGCAERSVANRFYALAGNSVQSEGPTSFPPETRSSDRNATEPAVEGRPHFLGKCMTSDFNGSAVQRYQLIRAFDTWPRQPHQARAGLHHDAADSLDRPDSLPWPG